MSYQMNKKTTFFLISILFLCLFLIPIPKLKAIENSEPSAIWQSTGTMNNDNLTSSDTIIVTCYQAASETSSSRIVAATSTPKASVSFDSQVITLAPGESQNVTFYVSNLGVNEDTPFSINITAYETWGNTQTSSITLTGTLKALVYGSDSTAPNNSSSPWWMQWWIWAIVAVACVTASSAVYFAKHHK